MENEWIDVSEVLSPYRVQLNARNARVGIRHSSKMDDGTFWLPGHPRVNDLRKAAKTMPNTNDIVATFNALGSAFAEVERKNPEAMRDMRKRLGRLHWLRASFRIS